MLYVRDPYDVYTTILHRQMYATIKKNAEALPERMKVLQNRAQRWSILAKMAAPIRLYSAASAEENWELLDYVEFLNAWNVMESDIEVDLDDSDVGFKLFFIKFHEVFVLIMNYCWHTITCFTISGNAWA